jgi:hypothetical protein
MRTVTQKIGNLLTAPRRPSLNNRRFQRPMIITQTCSALSSHNKAIPDSSCTSTRSQIFPQIRVAGRSVMHSAFADDTAENSPIRQQTCPVHVWIARPESQFPPRDLSTSPCRHYIPLSRTGADRIAVVCSGAFDVQTPPVTTGGPFWQSESAAYTTCSCPVPIMALPGCIPIVPEIRPMTGFMPFALSSSRSHQHRNSLRKYLSFAPRALVTKQPRSTADKYPPPYVGGGNGSNQTRRSKTTDASSL